MVIRWKRALFRGLVTAALALAVITATTLRYQPEFAPLYRVANAVCSTCNPIPNQAVLALLEGPSVFTTCLVIEKKDPSPTLLAQARTVDSTAVPASQCTRTDETGYRTPDGKQALRIAIYDWHRISRTKATVSISEVPGYVLGGAGSTCNLYRNGDGDWKVDDCRMQWIS